ncbi:MAG: class I SAM-dependent methyltransferase [Bacteroidetes bacterium]|nr:class I SAM-dependent methyltransferase [Bacteroidota bacterium]
MIKKLLNKLQIMFFILFLGCNQSISKKEMFKCNCIGTNSLNNEELEEYENKIHQDNLLKSKDDSNDLSYLQSSDNNKLNLYIKQWQAVTIGNKIPMTKNDLQVESFDHHDVRQIMSYLRESEYHHTGDEDILDLINSKISKNKYARILFIGTGLGETPNYFNKNEFAKVTGIDLCYSNIKYAKNKYPEVNFLHGNINDNHKFLKTCNFDNICILNKFSRYNNQIESLKSIRNISKEGTRLFIYDFRDIMPKNKNPLVSNGPKIYFFPIRIDNIEYILNNAGWKLIEIKILDNIFEKWYQKILSELEIKKINLENLYPTASHYIYGKYNTINEALKDRLLGGCLIMAEAI